MNKIIPCFLIAISLFALSACKKDKRVPLVTTSAIQTGIITAQVAGVVYDEGDSKVIEKGICWGEQSNVTIANNKIISSSQGSTFTEQITGLQDNRTYYVKAYAINSQGVAYGKEVAFTTQNDILPNMNLYLSTSSPGPTSADVRLYLNQFAKATYTAGICWSTMPMPTVSNNTVMVTQVNQNDPSHFTNNYYITLQNLATTTVYYVRAFCTNGLSTSYSNEVVLITEHFVRISNLNAINFTSAAITSTISGVSGSNISAVGICWNINPMPTVANFKWEMMVYPGASFTGSLTALNSGTTYYVRSFIKRTNGLYYYSPQKVINTYKNTVTDIDGNSYKTVQIGNKEWMVSNLRTTRYNTGASLTLVNNYSQWVNSTNSQSPVYCYYNYQASNNTTYGKLYPEYVALHPNIAPVGWHVATASEWQTLYTNNIPADLWDTGGTSFNGNYTGLSLYYGGEWDNGFNGMYYDGYFWAAPGTGSNNSITVNGTSYLFKTSPSVNGYSIRCVKD